MKVNHGLLEYPCIYAGSTVEWKRYRERTIMEIIVGEPVPANKTPNSFEVVVTTNYDEPARITVGPFIKGEDEFYLYRLIETLNIMAIAYPHGRGGDDTYEHIPHFLAWFADDMYVDEIMENEENLKRYYPSYPFTYAEYLLEAAAVQKFRQSCPMNPVTDYSTPNGYESFTIFYYDEQQIQHSTILV